MVNGTTPKSLGRHLICEFHGVDEALLKDKEFLRELLVKAAVASGSTIIGDYFHKFGSGMGVTGVVIIAESHLSIHTWPEYGYAAIDIFTCGENINPWSSLNLLRDELKPSKINVTEITRGLISIEATAKS